MIKMTIFIAIMKWKKREVTNGENKGTTYYLFRYKDGKSVMNYTPNDYYELQGI